MNNVDFISLERLSGKVEDSAFHAVVDSDLASLQSLLNKNLGKDPYKRSPAYFALTGRKGLWKVERKGATMLFCRHPHLDNEFLLFPATGENALALHMIVYKTLMRMGMSARFARVEREDVMNNDFIRIDEDMLDWAYPAHVLDVDRVIGHQGKEFQHFRQKLNALDMSKIRAVDIYPERDCQILLDIVKKWSKNEAIKVEPYIRQIELFKILPLAGRIIYFDDEPVAASIWEETDQEIGMANAYTHLALHEIKGVSQFVFLDMCAKLKSRGFSHVCIGGSESEGLDRFKRNLFPVESVNLSSWSAKSVHSRLPQSQKTAINLNRVAVA